MAYRGSVIGIMIAALVFSFTFVRFGPAGVVSAAGGTMTQDGEGYYLVEDAYDLQAINGNLSGKFRLVSDIDLSTFDSDGAGPNPVGIWRPIGSFPSSPFTGEFDGNGFAIRNLKMIGSQNRVGLFGYIDGATIRNVRLIHVDVTGGDQVGGLAGYAFQSAILQSSVSGTVQGGANTGLLAGYTVFTNISDSYVQGTVNDRYTVDPNPADNKGFGGLIGLLAQGSVVRSYSSAVIQAADTLDNYVGGLIGDNSGTSPNTSTSFWDSETSGVNHSAGGVGKTAAEMKQKSTFTGAGWDFTGTWGMIEGVTYPLLQDHYEKVALDSLTVTDADDAATPLVWDRAFASDYGLYEVKAVHKTENAAIAATPLSPGAEVSIMTDTDADGEPDFVTDPDGVGTVALSPGENKFWIQVSEPVTGGLAAAYVLTVIRDEGTPAYPHRITTPAQLAAIGDAAEGYGLDDAYELEANLDLSAYGAGYDGGAGWMPIGSGGGGFQGQFDGNGHWISHLYIDRSGTGNQGLFDTIADGAVVQNVHLREVNVRGGTNTGGLAGVNSGAITGASVSGTVQGASNVGGLVGSNAAGVIEDSFALGSVSGLAEVGGLVGLHTDAGAEVTGSYAAAAMTLEGGGTGPTGGLIGSTQNGAVVDASFWDKDVSLQEESSGSPNSGGKTTEEMMLRSTYTAEGWSIDPGNVNATWGMMNGSSYPLPRAVYEAVALDSITVDFAGAAEQWSVSFQPGEGAYEITASVPTTSAEIAAVPKTGASAADVDGSGAATKTVSLHPGHNPVEIGVPGDAGGVCRDAVPRVRMEPRRSGRVPRSSGDSGMDPGGGGGGGKRRDLERL